MPARSAIGSTCSNDDCTSVTWAGVMPALPASVLVVFSMRPLDDSGPSRRESTPYSIAQRSLLTQRSPSCCRVSQVHRSAASTATTATRITTQTMSRPSCHMRPRWFATRSSFAASAPGPGDPRRGVGLTVPGAPTADPVTPGQGGEYRPQEWLAGSTSRYGTVIFLASDVMLFAAFFSAYYVLRGANDPWPPPGVDLHVVRALVATIVLVSSSFTLIAADRALA